MMMMSCAGDDTRAPRVTVIRGSRELAKLSNNGSITSRANAGRGVRFRATSQPATDACSLADVSVHEN